MRRSTRYLALLAAAAVIAATSPTPGWAQGILSTKHNLSPQFGVGTDTRTVKASTQTDTLGAASTEVCVYCHTPHAADTTVAAPLWNRAVNLAGYTMYSSDTYDATTDAQPTGVSLACLSCHDGTIAFDALRNLPGPGGFSATPDKTNGTGGWSFSGTTNKMMPAGAANLGTDLSNDHPISMDYSTARSPSSTDNTGTAGFKVPNDPARGFTVVGVPLYAGKVQCGSCHDPHKANTNTFLRVSNNGSALCLTCHKKDG